MCVCAWVRVRPHTRELRKDSCCLKVLVLPLQRMLICMSGPVWSARIHRPAQIVTVTVQNLDRIHCKCLPEILNCSVLRDLLPAL